MLKLIHFVMASAHYERDVLATYVHAICALRREGIVALKGNSRIDFLFRDVVCSEMDHYILMWGSLWIVGDLLDPGSLQCVVILGMVLTACHVL